MTCGPGRWLTGRIVLIDHGGLQGLSVNAPVSVVDGHLHLVATVRIGIAGQLKVLGSIEPQLTGDRVDGKVSRIVPARDCKRQHIAGQITIAGRDRGHAGRPLDDDHRCHRSTSVTVDHRCVVDGRDREVEGAAGAGARAVIDAEVKAVAGGLAAVVVVGDQARVEIGLGEGVADAEGRAAQPQRAIGRWPRSACRPAAPRCCRRRWSRSIAVVSTLPVEASLTVVPVLVARTSSSLTGVIVRLNVPLELVPAPSSTREGKAVAGGLAAVVVVGDQARVEVGLGEGVADAQGRAAQPQRAVARWPKSACRPAAPPCCRRRWSRSIAVVSTLPVEASLTVVPVLVARTSSSLTGVIVRLNVPLQLVPAPSSTREVKAVADGLAAVVVVGHQARVDVGLGEGVADAEGRAAQVAACRCRWPW